nr:DNA-directed DNA polymerase [Tanacetum cinerariifolium]
MGSSILSSSIEEDNLGSGKLSSKVTLRDSSILIVSLLSTMKLDQFTQFYFSSLTEEEGWNRIEEYVQYQDDLWDDPSPFMNVSFVSEAMQPTLRGRLKRACKQISFLETPTQEVSLKNLYLICDYCGGTHEADECEQNNPSEQIKEAKKGCRGWWLFLIFKQIHINLPFLETMIHMPKGAKELKDLLSHKEKIKKAPPSVKLSEECSAIIQRSLPQKEGDPGISKLKPTKMSIQLADRSIKYPIVVYENLLVKVRIIIFLVDFVVLKMDEDELVTIILGRPFLTTTRAMIDENNQLPVVISSALSTDEKTRLLEVLQNHKGAIAWSIADIKGIDSSFCTHKILMEDEFKPSIQTQRRVTPNIKEVSPVQVVLKKGGMTVVKNDKDEFITQRTVTGWRVSKYIQILITPEDQEKTTFTCPYGTFTYKQMPFELCNAPSTFQRCMTAIFHELIEDSMEVFMDDFSVFGSSFDHYLKNLEKMLKSGPSGGQHGIATTARKVFEAGFYWPHIFRDARKLV